MSFGRWLFGLAFRAARTTLILLVLTLSVSPAASAGQDEGESGVEATVEPLDPVAIAELTLDEDFQIGDLIPDTELSAGVDRIAATSAEYDAAVAAYLDKIVAVAEATTSLATAEATLLQVHDRREKVRETIGVRRRDRRAIIRELDRIENRLRELAITEFVGSGNTEANEAVSGLDPTALAESSRSVQLVQVVSDVQVDRREVLEPALLALDLDQERDLTQLARLAQTVTQTQNDIEDWMVASLNFSAEIPDLELAVREHRVLAEVVGLDFAVVVLDAYNNAAILSEKIHPGCGVEWWMLAGIGRVESGHGTFGDSEVLADGATSDEIVGIQLDGSSDTAVIADTDGGALDHDPIFDRAVGPMQFIPSTWVGNGLDGNADGIIDPHNLYDAAFSAAHYLCRTAGNVSTIEGLKRGYFAYNHRDSYVEKVLGFALDYREFALSV
ncbi:MAG: lytic transglycosylase domain-containing protein [Acidimicrobiales bacterium]